MQEFRGGEAEASLGRVAPTSLHLWTVAPMNAKELRRLMPQSAKDVEGARQFVGLGPDNLTLVVPEMLRQLKDEASPLTQVYAEFFASEGEVFAEEVCKALSNSKLEYQRYILVSRVLPRWSR